MEKRIIGTVLLITIIIIVGVIVWGNKQSAKLQASTLPLSLQSDGE